MFILDSLFISGFRWVLDTVRTAADAEMDDDAALRDELMAAEMRREMGEISDEAFAAIETDLLARIRRIRERRDGGSGPIAFGGGDPSSDAPFAVEATVSGDFHEPPPAPPVSAAGEPPPATMDRPPRTPPRRVPRRGRTAARRKIRKP